MSDDDESVRVPELIAALAEATTDSEAVDSAVYVELDGEVLPIRQVRPVEWHAGYECFVVKVDLA